MKTKIEHNQIYAISNMLRERCKKGGGSKAKKMKVKVQK